MLGEAAGLPDWDDEDGPSIDELEAMAEANESSDQDEAGMWSETFKSHSDSKPYGTATPSLLCLDLQFDLCCTH